MRTPVGLPDSLKDREQHARRPSTRSHVAVGAELDSGSHSQLSANPSHSQDKSDKWCSSPRDALGTRGPGQRSDSRSLIRIPEGLACTAFSKCQHGLGPSLLCQAALVTLQGEWYTQRLLAGLRAVFQGGLSIPVLSLPRRNGGSLEEPGIQLALRL